MSNTYVFSYSGDFSCQADSEEEAWNEFISTVNYIEADLVLVYEGGLA